MARLFGAVVACGLLMLTVGQFLLTVAFAALPVWSWMPSWYQRLVPLAAVISLFAMALSRSTPSLIRQAYAAVFLAVPVIFMGLAAAIGGVEFEIHKERLIAPWPWLGAIGWLLLVVEPLWSRFKNFRGTNVHKG
jgi:hypothetical protein